MPATRWKEMKISSAEFSSAGSHIARDHAPQAHGRHPRCAAASSKEDSTLARSLAARNATGMRDACQTPTWQMDDELS